MKNLTVLFTLVCLATPVLAQDKEGCKDHPLFQNRVPNYIIANCEQKDFHQYEFYANANGTKSEKVEGKYFFYDYRPSAAPRTPVEIAKQYQAALKKIGGEALYDAPGATSVKIKKGAAETWVYISASSNYYYIYIVEKGGLEQVVTANEMLNALNKDGFIALDIHFDTGKSTVKEESMPIIEQMIDALKTNAALKVSIEGHTDNVGDAKSNKTLSEERAKAVVAALVKGGVDAKRLASKGFGSETPVADNRTEEGRAKNRRVEMVKMK